MPTWRWDTCPQTVQLGGAMAIDKSAAEAAVQKLADAMDIGLMDGRRRDHKNRE